jgi:predicted amidohydrolase
VPHPLLAVGQMTASNKPDDNHAIVTEQIAEAKRRGASLIVLPECFAFMGEKDREVLGVAEPLEGPFFSRFAALAKAHGIWVAFGGFPEKGPDDDHCYNTQVLVDDTGTIRSTYRKIHLFDVDIPGGPRLLETNGTAPGRDVVAADSPVGKLGLTICYDLRFPELYLSLAKLGAQVLLAPAAFTLTTGKEHWEVLLRARAIETQCYVAAAAQRGRHNDRRHSYGHAMIVDPWGSVIAQVVDGTGIAVAEIDLDHLKSVRQRMPVMAHRRPDIYGDVKPQ